MGNGRDGIVYELINNGAFAFKWKSANCYEVEIIDYH